MRAPGSVDRSGAWHFGTGLLAGLILAAILGRLAPSGGEDDLRHYGEVRDFVQQAFVEETDRSELVDRALHGLVESLDDYSRYYNQPEVGGLERETGGRYEGFGVVFRRPYTRARVLFTMPGSPARAGGLEVGDLVLRLDGQSIEAMREEDVHAIIADEARKKLTFTVRGLTGETREATLTRRSLIDPTVRHERMLDDERGVGYLAIRSFSHETPDEFDRAFNRLRGRGLRALVLDLRGNFGGVLSSAVHIARRFVPGGVIVSTEGRGDPVVYEAEPDEALFTGIPLVVLVDEGSASASEVLAGALRDHRVAVLCGSPTYGKGMVQTIRHFPASEAVAKVTSSYYYTPSHTNLERTALGRDYGLLPDLAVPLTGLERREVYTSLEAISPPGDMLAAIRVWEEAEGLVLLDTNPPDAQLQAGLDLLNGQRPGPQALRDET
jgi:carboxyl-terminal processing protease